FEMVTGRVPFTASNPLSVIAAQQSTPPPSPRKFNPSLPASIEQPLLTGLAKDPARRPQTATDFVDALAAAIPGSASQYPMTPPPVQQLPPTPTAIEPPPSASYAPQPPAPPQYTPPPSYGAPPYTPAPPAASPYASPAPYATAAATPPPSYPAMAPTPAPVQQQYTPAPVYPAAPQQWVSPPPARREGASGWLLGALWVGFAVSLLVAVLAIIAPLSADLDDTARGGWVSFGFVSTIAAALSLAAAVGLTARDRWAPGVAWASVAALAITIVEVPVAIVAGWGLVQAPKGTLVAPQSRPGSGLRAGLPLAGGALIMLILMATTVYGWNQAGTTPAPAGEASPSARPAACDIILPDTPINLNAVGSSCGLTPASMVTALDCASVTALPSALSAVSWDYIKQQATNVGTLAIDSAGCHLATPTYRTSSELDSRAKVDPSNVLMVADFQQPQGKVDVGLSYGCDDTGCITTDLYTVDSSVYIGEDDNSKVVSQTVKTRLGVNRLVLAIHGNQIRSWFNGTLIATETAGRAHGAGIYEMWMIDYDKAGPASLQLMRFAVINLSGRLELLFRPLPASPRSGEVTAGKKGPGLHRTPA